MLNHTQTNRPLTSHAFWELVLAPPIGSIERYRVAE